MNIGMKTQTHIKNTEKSTLAGYCDGVDGDMFTQHTSWLFFLSPNTNLKGADAQ